MPILRPHCHWTTLCQSAGSDERFSSVLRHQCGALSALPVLSSAINRKFGGMKFTYNNRS